MTTCLFIRDKCNIHLVADGLMTKSGYILNNSQSKILNPLPNIYLTGSGLWHDIEFVSNKIAHIINKNNINYDEHFNIYLALREISKDLDNTATEIIIIIDNTAYLMLHHSLSIIEENFYTIGSGEKYALAIWEYINFFCKKPIIEIINDIYFTIAGNLDIHTNSTIKIETISIKG